MERRMAREPHYPDDSPIGSGAAGGASDPSPAPAPPAAPEKPVDPKRSKHLMAGAAIGIGSAAIVAALLYANRRGKGEKG